MKTKVEERFSKFFEKWMCQLDEYLQHLQKKPLSVFKLVNSIRTNGVLSSSLVDLTQEHMRKIEALRVKIRLEEEKLEREIERQQVAVADRKMAELVRLVLRVKNGEQVRQALQVALKGVMAGLEKVMKAANCVRLRTLKGVLDVLSPLQCVEFLVGIDMLQILLRQWGKKRICTIN
ncbi:protein DOG1-like 4 [Hevea brasiliensis]|uniref:protein DOG1-like 4 n=1 Tax=Hevea brasiliensis TaxID=3981 RepID=UPI0025F638AC|nr:protein DOG1-like 4 [Hevea brasiliensis]